MQADPHGNEHPEQIKKGGYSDLLKFYYILKTLIELNKERGKDTKEIIDGLIESFEKDLAAYKEDIGEKMRR